MILLATSSSLNSRQICSACALEPWFAAGRRSQPCLAMHCFPSDCQSLCCVSFAMGCLLHGKLNPACWPYGAWQFFDVGRLPSDWTSRSNWAISVWLKKMNREELVADCFLVRSTLLYSDSKTIVALIGEKALQLQRKLLVYQELSCLLVSSPPCSRPAATAVGSWCAPSRKVLEEPCLRRCQVTCSAVFPVVGRQRQSDCFGMTF